jgi:hypothetical protein
MAYFKKSLSTRLVVPKSCKLCFLNVIGLIQSTAPDCRPHASPHTFRIPTHQTIPRPHALMDHRYNPRPFSIQNSNSYSCMSQTFMLQGSHSGPTPVMRWGGSPTAGQTSMWLPLPPPAGYWPPPPPIGHTGQSSITPPPHSSPGYWSPL